MNPENVADFLRRYGVSGIFFILAAINLISYVDNDSGNGLALAILFVCLGTLAAIFSDFLKAILDGVLDAFKQPITDWLISRIEIGWWGVTARFQSRYYQHLITACQGYRPQGLTLQGPTLALDKIFVPLGVATQVAEQASSAMIQPTRTAHQSTIWDFLARSADQQSYRRIAVIGPPGSGKTTLLVHLALTYAKNAQRRQHRQAPRLVPILLSLRDVREAIARDRPSLAALIKQQPAIRQLNPKQRWFETRLTQGKCLVMLDGLDEVANETQRQQISAWVDQQMRNYPTSCFILTSRPAGYRNASLTEEGIALESQPFTLEQMQQFIRNWYVQTELISRPVQRARDRRRLRREALAKANNLIERIETNSPLSAMAFNPLLLTMIATVHRFRGALPGHRVELYAEICDVLLGKRQTAKRLPLSLTIAQKRSVLQALALKLMERNTREFDAELGTTLIGKDLKETVGDDLPPAEFLRDIELDSGLLVQKEQGIYEFAHLSFQEYLASVQVSVQQQEHLLVEQIDNSWWTETIRLYAVQVRDATSIVQAALDAAREGSEESAITTLTLAHGCIQEEATVDERVKASLRSMIEDQLKSSDRSLFKLAAEVKLSGRFNNLRSIAADVYIDSDYITHAEYQLFLDDQQRLGRYYRPDHWTLFRFTPAAAPAPIVGVRAEDAHAFCHWLTQRRTSLGFRYRLPMDYEAIQYPSHDRPSSGQSVGYWCITRNRLVLQGIRPDPWRQWHDELLPKVRDALERDRLVAENLVPPAVTSLTLNDTHPVRLTLDATLDLSRALQKIADPKLTRAFALIRNLGQHRTTDDIRALNRAIIQARNALPKRDRLLNRQYNQDRDLIDVRAYLLLIIILWERLGDRYGSVTHRRQHRHFMRFLAQRDETIQRECIQNRDETLNLYAFFVLVDARRSGQMPAWESIRIVQIAG
ncbi:MAG: NACHT domain-containing protein [Elainellaceae cyanobacterium]